MFYTTEVFVRPIAPTQFAYYHPIELLQLGMTEADVNRLVGRLLDLGLPVGNLLSDTTATPGGFDLYGLRHLGSFDACAPPADAHLYSRSHRPRLLRKIPVAVKLLRPGSMAGDHFMGFLDELRAMQCLSHPNLIRLHGVVLSNPIMMVTELAPLGSLLLHLRAQSLCAGSTSTLRCKSSLTSSTVPAVPTALQADALWDMSVQIARGMAYLSARGLVHRDLAARNILLAAVRKDEFPQVKIGDFGLVRAVATAASTDANKRAGDDNDELENKEAVDAVYTGRIEQRIPFAWSAPECLRKRVFSQASDIWSWAVTCWEIWTNGAAPWPGQDARQLLSLLETGRRLAWPRSICPRRFYQIMLACWRAESHRRPTFAYLAKRLNEVNICHMTLVVTVPSCAPLCSTSTLSAT
ncbi:activated CDC42 kinase 1 [Paragonimus westermani]|uniref:Activated CDC42 kinase 1 n=1 Tax=Paragonimus westermani TaxID=34504 RepID=A0A5J4P5P8_9TREM|nr:activated CDC42 kinase 1 [Paragonimus westermani]